MSKKISSTNKIIFESHNVSLLSLIEKINYLNGVNEVLQTIVDKPLILHCRVANIRQGAVIIEADSSAWATLLRYQLPCILQKFRATKGLESLSNIDCYVSPKVYEPILAPKSIPAISLQSAKILELTAQGIKHPALKATLQRIAGRAKAHPRKE